MIEFSCKVCSREFKVDEEKAGMRGKCPKCNAILEVPLISESSMIFDEIEMSCDDQTLQDIYDGIMENAPNLILNHSIIERKMIRMTISTNNGRKQIVCLARTDEESHENRHLIILSTVGNLTEEEQYFTALRIANSDPFVNVCLDDECLLWVRSIVELNRLEVGKALHRTISVAAMADTLENHFFGWDES
jgi:hypothetical protein